MSWNVNGIRAISKKSEWEWFKKNDSDIICLQETKANQEQLSDDLAKPKGWNSYFASSVVKKGYSGVAIFSKIEPKNIVYELPFAEWQGEGRIIHLEYEKMHFFNGYFPNGGVEILDDFGKPTGKFKRVPYKMGFFDAFFKYAQECRKSKPIVVCGDFNIAHKPIDLARPKQNEKSTGFLLEERDFLDKFVSAGYIDTFRYIHGDIPDKYTWWSYKSQARPKNIGWRIDYFFVSKELESNLKNAWIADDIFGSDHCPIGIELDL